MAPRNQVTTTGRSDGVHVVEAGGAFAPGAVIGPFQILRLLGEGGMGTVYLARDASLGRKVAIKVLRPDLIGRQESLARFLLEARATAAFNHPHIVSIYSVGEHESVPYVALEYLEGHTLRDRLDEGRLGVLEALRMALAIADALAEAHAHGILHRDLKPENVLLPKDGRLRVVDFGLAKIIDDAPVSRALLASVETAAASMRAVAAGFVSKPGAICGTPAYMAPEQWLAEATAATDVWALGLLLCEMLSGQRPYDDVTGVEMAVTVLSSNPVPLPPLGEAVPGVATLVARCLEKDAVRRPTAATAREVLEELLRDGRERPTREIDDNPFRGLAPFAERHADDFFGRDAEITAFVERLREQPVVPLVGPSGAGKSSFVRAGVVPRLREQGHWSVITVRPGSDPFQALATRLVAKDSASDSGTTGTAGDDEKALALAASLARAPALLGTTLVERARAERGKVLLFADGLEELYTLVPNEGTRRAFMQALCTAADDALDPVRVVFTLRDDFLGRLAEGATAREALGRLVVMRSPDQDALDEILRRPVAARGYIYDDPALVGEMLAAVRGEPACLPLLQFACAALWEQRDAARKLLLRTAYDAMGGVAGALARHADGVLEGLSPAEVRLARTMLLRMVTPNGTRRTLARHEATEGLTAAAEAVLDRLVVARLVSARKAHGQGDADAEIDLAHESLLSRWAQLARWIEASHEEISVLSDVRVAAEGWEKRGAREEDVWQADALRDVERVLSRATSPLPEIVARFLAAGAARARRALRRRRVAFASAAALMLAIAAGSLFAALLVSGQKRTAEAHRARAEAERRKAEHETAEAERQGAESALARGDGLQARALLRSALEVEDSRTARGLWRRAEAAPQLWHMELGVTPVLGVSPDGKRVAIGRNDGPILVLDTATLTSRMLRGHRGAVHAVRFSADGASLTSVAASGEVRVWDLSTGTSRPRMVPSAQLRSGVVLSQDAARLAVAMKDAVFLVDLAGGAARPVAGSAGGLRQIALSDDGEILAMPTGDGVRIVRALTGEPVRALPARGPISALTFDPARTHLAVAELDRIRVWDLATGVPHVVPMPSQSLSWLAFSPDGSSLAFSNNSEVSILRAPFEGRPARTLRGFTSVPDVAWTSGSEIVTATPFTGLVELWNLRGSDAMIEPSAHGEIVFQIAFDPRGDHLASASVDRTVRVWGRDGRSTILARSTAAISSLAWSPDGGVVAFGGDDTAVHRVDAQTGAEREPLRGHTGQVFQLAFRPDGRELASASPDRTARLWEVISGKEKHLLRHSDAANAVAYDPLGKRLATSGYVDHTVHLWDVVTGRAERVLDSGGISRGVAFSPDGARLAAGTAAGVALWDLKSFERRIVPEAAKVGWPSFHPDGHRVGIPCGNGIARITDLDRGGTASLVGHQRGTDVNFLVFSPDGKLAATSGDDGTVRLWDADSGHPIWRAPLLLPSPPRLFSQHGWERLDDASARADPPHGAHFRAAVEERARFVAASDDGKSFCIATHDLDLELWDAEADERRFTTPVPDLSEVVALSDTCGALAGDEALLFDRTGARAVLHAHATAVGRREGAILVAADAKVITFDGSGKATATTAGDSAITALLKLGDAFAVGYREGGIAVLSPGGTNPQAFATTALSPSAVTRLVEGAGGTLVAGYASGVVAVFDAKTGARLSTARLHGPVVHLLAAGFAVYAASDLGDHTVVDLTLYAQPRCELLRDVWSRVPVAWEDGRLVARGAPAGHECAR